MIMYIVGGITVALVLFVGVIIIIICWKLRVRRDVDVEKNGKQYDEDFLTDVSSFQFSQYNEIYKMIWSLNFGNVNSMGQL